MSIRQTILQRLATSKNAAVERAVAEALALSDGPEQTQLAEVLLTRNRRPGWVALVRHFDRLNETLQDRLLQNPRDLFGPLSDTMDEAVGPGRHNVIEIVRKAADPKLVFLLTEALSDPRDEVRRLAADSFLEAVRRFRHQLRGTGPADDAGHADPHQLRRAIDFGVRQFKLHRQNSVVLAALMFERQQDAALWPLFHDPHDEASRAATAILRQVNDPDLAAAVFLALASPLKPAALAGLASAADPAVCRALADESYRLLDPVLRAQAQTLGRIRMFLSTNSPPPWDADSWPAWLRLIDALGLDPREKLAWYVRLVESLAARADTVGGRMLIVRAIADLHTPEAQTALVPLTSDPAEPVARLAARCLITRRQAEWRPHAGAILQSPHASVRKLVAQAFSPGQFERLWNQYQKLPPAVAHTTTRTISANDQLFSDQLAVKLKNPAEAAQAVRMLASLPDIREYRDHIIGLCAHPDPRVVSSAVKLIGRLEDPRLRDLLEAAARHRDPRVRANAVEAMEALHVADKSQQVFALLNSQFSRERANAIKAISQFDFATSRECLLKMLVDPSPNHRISAMWVVGQLGFLDIVRTLGTLARRDANPRVRARAQEMLEKIDDATRIAAG